MERYVSFENIDCFENACCVVDEVLVLFKEKPEASNTFWERFIKKIPPAYYTRTPDEDVLYLVCSHVFYLEELFELHDHEEGSLAIEKAEIECC